MSENENKNDKTVQIINGVRLVVGETELVRNETPFGTMILYYGNIAKLNGKRASSLPADKYKEIVSAYIEQNKNTTPKKQLDAEEKAENHIPDRSDSSVTVSDTRRMQSVPDISMIGKEETEDAEEIEEETENSDADKNQDDQKNTNYSKKTKKGKSFDEEDLDMRKRKKKNRYDQEDSDVYVENYDDTDEDEDDEYEESEEESDYDDEESEYEEEDEETDDESSGHSYKAGFIAALIAAFLFFGTSVFLVLTTMNIIPVSLPWMTVSDNSSGEEINVVRLAADVTAGEQIESADLEEVAVTKDKFDELSSGKVLDGSGTEITDSAILYSNVEDVIGKYASSTLKKGEYITVSDFSDIVSGEKTITIDVDGEQVTVPVTVTQTGNSSISVYAICTNTTEDGKVNNIAMKLGEFSLEGRNLMDIKNEDGESVIEQLLKEQAENQKKAEEEATAESSASPETTATPENTAPADSE